MKLQRLIKSHRVGLAATLVAAATLGGMPLMAADTISTPPDAQANSAAVPANLTGPTREVVKLAVSGVSEDVIKAYVYHSPSSFNLNADTIIHLKGVGVSADVLAAMLNRDTMLHDQAALNNRGGSPTQMVQPAIPQAPPANPPGPTDMPPQPDYSVTAPPPASTYYYPDYSYGYDYPYPYSYYGGYYPYYGGLYLGWGRGWGYGYRGRFGFGGRGIGVQPFGGRGFGRSGGGHSGGGGAGRH